VAASGLKWARIELSPDYATILDFERRFPSATSVAFRSFLGVD
jgi:hypothetical protein